MEGEGSDGGTDGGEESGGAGLSFRPQAVVFVGKRSFAFVGGRSRWRAVVFVRGRGVVSWALVIRAWGSSSSALSFVVAVGLGCRLWAPGRRSWVVGPVRGRCTSFVAGGLMCGVVVVGRVVATLHRSYGCHVALLATWPLYPGVRKDGGGKWVFT